MRIAWHKPPSGYPYRWRLNWVRRLSGGLPIVGFTVTTPQAIVKVVASDRPAKGTEGHG